MFAAGESWRVAVPVAAGTTLFAYFVFERLLVLPWPLPLWNVLGWMS
jgi:hypothetical protein